MVLASSQMWSGPPDKVDAVGTGAGRDSVKKLAPHTLYTVGLGGEYTSSCCLTGCAEPEFSEMYHSDCLLHVSVPQETRKLFFLLFGWDPHCH